MADAPNLPAYRWVIVLASALILALAMGSVVNGISAYIVPLQEAHGWQRGEVALINTCGIIGLALGGMVIGRWADGRSTRTIVLFGVSVLGLCYIAAGFVTDLWLLYALFLVAGFFGAGAIFPTVMAAVGRWFPVGAGVAIGIATAGQALGQGGVPFLSAYLIRAYGVAAAFGITGGAMLALLVPLALLLRQPPEVTAANATNAAAAKGSTLPVNTVVWRMSIATIGCCTCMSVPLIHLVPLVQDICGVPLDQASGVAFAMMLIAIAGRIGFGRLADMIGALPAYMTATAWMTLLVFWFVQLDTLHSFYIYALIYGFGYAGVMTGVLTSITALTPASRRAYAMGVVSMFAWFGHAIGGYMGGALYDLTGGYSWPFAVAALAGVMNLIVVSTLWRRTGGLAAQPA